MKNKCLFILLAVCLGLPALSPGQSISTGVPGFISYQGRVLDSTGAPVGTGTPVNRTVIFRVWDHPSNILASNLIYSEQQTVTISEGKFSVLVGQGVATDGTQFSFSETTKGPPASIANAFNGSARYLGVTVDDGTAALDNEIAPRQQVVTSAFAFRSKYAETLGTSANTALTVLDSGNIGVGTSAPSAKFEISTGPIAVSMLKLAQNSSTWGTAQIFNDFRYISAGGGDPASSGKSFNVGAGGVSIGYPNVPTYGSADALYVNGNVGIGTISPIAKFNVVNAGTGDTAVFQAPGKGTVASHIHNGTNGDIYWRSASPAGNVILQDTGGNVGIGVNPPVYKLQVNGSLYSQSLETGTVNMAPSRTRGVGRPIGIGGCYIEWGNQAPGSYGQTFILNNQEGGNPGIFLGEVSNAHSINWSLFTQPSRTDINGHIYAWSFNATSDERIKSVVGRSRAETDLDTVRKLQVTDYHYIDQERGKELQKGFIAQEVQELIPEAVKNTGAAYIPNIYADAKELKFDKAAKSVTIQMAKDHHLKVGDQVRMTADEERHDLKVAAVKDDRTFVVGPMPAKPAKVFVYGKQVDDLLAVDYNRLFTTGIGAIQELAKQVDTVTRENAELKAKLAASEQRLAAMDATDKAIEAKLAALEKRFSADEAAASTVSVKPAK